MHMTSLLAATLLAGLFLLTTPTQAGETFTQPPPKEFKCYTCKDCGDPFDKTKTGVALNKCAPTEFFCYKFTHPDKKVDRGCTTVVNTCPTAGKGCDTCQKTECNSARSLQATLGLPIASIAAVITGAMWFRRQ